MSVYTQPRINGCEHRITLASSFDARNKTWQIKSPLSSYAWLLALSITPSSEVTAIMILMCILLVCVCPEIIQCIILCIH